METMIADDLEVWLGSVRGPFAESEELRDWEGEICSSAGFASRLRERFDDMVLVRAAHLHRVPATLLRRALPAGVLDGEVLGILEGIERLEALRAYVETDSVTDRLLADVLPSLSDPRAHLLFVLGQIFAIDPEERFSRWLLEFQLAGTARSPAAARGEIRADARESDHRFLSSVISPTASLSGLWHERNVVEDAALCLRDPERFDELAHFATSEPVLETLRQHVERVRAALGAAAGDVAVRWEWRHLERLNQKLLQGKAERGWTGSLAGCGFVSVVCPDVARCYHVLGVVHQHFRYEERGQLRDLLGQPTLTGYRSIHTEVEIIGASAARPELVAIRLVPAEGEEELFRPADRQTLARLGAAAQEHGAKSTSALPLVVFTPDGRPIRLPAGATVLNFAVAIHHRLLILARGARVNHESRGLLHRLSPGDVVWLDVGDIPRPLPRDWERRVPPETVPSLRRLFRRIYVPELAGRGRHWLREQLLQHYFGGGELPDDPQLDALVKVAQQGLRAGGPRTDDPEQWWLRQLGIFDALEHDQHLPYELLITPQQREVLVARMAQNLDLREVLTQLGRDVSLEGYGLESCSLCQPGAADTECTAVLAGRTVTLHRPGASCGEGGTSVRRIGRVRAQYVVVEGSDRAGVAADVLETCAKHKVGVVEIAAVRAPGGRALIRLRLDSIAPTLRDRLLAALLFVNGVKHVAPPTASPSELEQWLLPPRVGQEPSEPTDVPVPLLPPPSVPPFAGGSFIINEKHFYGMGDERERILKLIRDASAFDASRGVRVFLQGPLKSGKTSLAHAVLRDLRTQEYPPCITAYYAARTADPWSVYQRHMAAELLDAAREAAVVDGRELPLNLEHRSLEELILTIRRTLGRAVVLVIDEAVRMFKASDDDDDECLALERFRDLIDSTPGLAVLFVGPNAPIRRLNWTLRRILGTSEPATPPRLTLKELEDMMRARKAGNFNIDWRGSIPKHLLTLTGGNPYWIAGLLTKMWKDGVERDPNRLVYTRTLVRPALEEVIRERDYFSDRYDPVRGWPPRKVRVLRLVLEICASHRYRSSMAIVGHSKGEIMDAVRQRLGQPISDAKLSELVDELLDELAARGAVRSRSKSHRNTRSIWEITAPILAAHIHSVRDRKDWFE